MAEIVEVEAVPTRYCEPFRMDIEVETCRTRIVAIKTQLEREGLGSLSQEQRKCHECEASTEQDLETKADDNLNPGGNVMNTGLSLVNNTLADQLKRLNDPTLKGDDLIEEIERTKAMTEISKQTIDVAKVALDAIKTVSPAQMPGFLQLEDKASN